MWTFEKKARKKGFSIIAGVDEAGRGPLAGPVVSGAVILPSAFSDCEINDSKKLSAKKRDQLYEKIYAQALSVGVGVVSPQEIDRINILQASLYSMVLAVRNLSQSPDFLLIDGKFTLSLNNLAQKAVVKGDSLSISIASASIIAKVTRDRIMQEYHTKYPQYDFDRHKGYPTKAHKAAIQKFGPSPIHRMTFRGVRAEAQKSLFD